MGFSRKNNAKDSLTRSFKKDEDFILLTNQQLGGILEENRADYEVIKLSADLYSPDKNIRSLIKYVLKQRKNGRNL